MGDDLSELSKLKETLQKLQAENISLKAQLGSMSQEERDVARETAATVEEISKLSNALISVRAEVLAAKTKLLESTAELTAAKEKKQVLGDLISETQSTKDALENANRDIHVVNESKQVAEQRQAAANATSGSFEGDLFGFDPTPAPASIPQPTNLPAPAPTPPPENIAPPVAPAAFDPAQGFGSVESPPVKESSMSIPVPSDSSGFSGIPDPEPSQFGATTLGAVPAIDGPSALTRGAFGNNPPATSAAVPSKAEVESLRQQALDAEQSAREAEETRRTLAIEADKLKQMAETAEAEVRALQEKAATKKRGFGRGKKNIQKDIEQASQDAAERKKHFMEMQTQASNAQTLAMDSKRQADKLRQQAEQAELDLAAAESAKEAQQSSAPAPVQATGTTSGDYGFGNQTEPSPYGGLSLGFGNGAPASSEGFGGFGSGIMGGSGDSGGGIMGGSGGSGISIPTPQAGADSYNYDNPFK
eukprot:CAMPEP_0116565754 /NCGR_PEP_ID=MMETSP0397-20121206/14068_1 /TAXON_ID=216820 /ORGANISM="Cyclophora tenuis, Strain ECT3854" /LENGTH=475 /DNA_ID=CAMNT_0004092551 /DNA_START=35 /DNA_END=1462 /DNA_ORIENTATION=-